MSELLQPTPDFSVSWSESEGELKIESPDYPGYSVMASNMGIGIDSPLGPIHHRSISDYQQFQAVPSDFPSEKYKHLQVLEAGPGLAELIPEVALTFELRPIAIDPANYQLIICLLEKVREEADRYRFYPSDARMLIRRAKIILNPNFVRLYNMTLEDAVDTYPELKGIADIIVDFKGPSHYGDLSRVWQIENHYLVKPKPIKPLYLPSLRRSLI